MFEYTAHLVSATPTVMPWLVPLALLLAALGAAFRPDARRWVLPAAGFSCAVAAAHIVWLVAQPAAQRALVAHLGTAIRVGSFDVSLTLWVDTLSGAVALALALVGLVSISSAARSAEPRALPAAALATGGALLAVLADGVLPLLLGWAALALAALVMTAPTQGYAGFAVARLAEVALVAGVVTLSWGLGGAFGEGRVYTPDFRPTLVSVEAPLAPDGGREAPREAQGKVPKGNLSMRALPGSRLALGEMDLCEIDRSGELGGVATPVDPCRKAARPPFANLPLPATLHELHVVPGPGSHELVVEKVRVSAHRTTHIALTGPTLSLTETSLQLALRDASGNHALRTAIARRKLYGVSLLELALGFISIGIAARALLFPFGACRATPSLSLLGQGAAAYLALRLAPLLSLAPIASSILTLLALVTLLAAADRAARGSEEGSGDAIAALVLIAAAVGAYVAGVGLLCAMLPAAAVSMAARQARLALAARLAAVAIAAAPLPLVGGFGAREELLWRAFTQQNVAVLPGVLIAVAVVVGWSVLSLAAFRLSRVTSLKSTRKRKADTALQRLLVAVAIGALAVGALFVAPAAFGASAPSLAQSWVAPSFAPAEPSFEPAAAELRLVWLVLGYGLALGAWFWARRAAELPWPSLEVLARIELSATRAVGSALDGLSRAVARVERRLDQSSQGTPQEPS